MNCFDAAGSSSDEESGNFRGAVPTSVVITQATFDALIRGRTFKTWEELLEVLPEVDEGHGPRYHEGQSESVFKLDPLQILGWVASLGIFSSVISLILYTESQEDPWKGIAITAVYGGLLWLGLANASPRIAGILWPHLPCIATVICMELDSVLFKSDVIAKNWQAHVFLAGVVPHIVCVAGLLLRLPEDPDRSVLACNIYLSILTTAGIIHSLVRPTPEKGTDTDTLQELWDFYNRFLLGLGIVFIVAAVRLWRYPSKWGPVEMVSWLLNVACAGIWLACSNLLLMSSRSLLEWTAFGLVFMAMWVLGTTLDRTGPLLFAVLGFGLVVVKLAWECTMAGGLLWGLLCGAAVAAVLIGFGHFYSKSVARNQAMALGLLS